MAFECRILADSVNTSGDRLVTFCVTYPRIIHSEILTHRMLSRSSASSRAIPTVRLLERIMLDPFIPMYIGANQKGMQAGEELSEEKRQEAVAKWLDARNDAVRYARNLSALGVHKQVVNRLVEPWMWITVIISATERTNFYGLRDHEAAEPHFQHLARMMRDAEKASTPKLLQPGDWHMPLVDVDAEDTAALDSYMIPPDEILPFDQMTIGKTVRVKCAVGRCARVSYLTHDGRRAIDEDIRLYNDLAVQVPLHASPAEHVAVALASSKRVGNFVGWGQLRKALPNEHIGGVMP